MDCPVKIFHMILKLLCKYYQNENPITDILSFGRRVFYITFCSALLIIKQLEFGATPSELKNINILCQKAIYLLLIKGQQR